MTRSGARCHGISHRGDTRAVHAATPQAGGLSELLAPLIDHPGTSAVFCDIDGTLAPIVERAAEATVPDDARDALRALAGTYALVGCLSGRRAGEARRLVGLDDLTYIGNHGFERLLPDAADVQPDPAVAGHEDAAPAFVSGLDSAELDSLGLMVEDKGPIRALHWRSAADEASAEARAREIAGDAIGRNLVPHWGRKVLEIRPAVHLDKGTALAELLEERDMARALFGGDDRTDIDAFRTLRDLREAGDLETAVCVGIDSEEGPRELREEADVMVDGPAGFLDVLRMLGA
jgi:trehalose 6-phosphate phosphatase